MTKQEQTNNPYNTCCWRALSECKDCPLASRLKCRYNSGDLFHFMGLFWTFAIPAFIGMIVGGYGWYILGEVGFMIIFFNFWEIRILCSHCPYYAEKRKILHCIANYGFLKVWKYHPEPMSNSEKVQLIIGFIILFIYPFIFLIIGKQYIFTFLAVWGGIMFVWTLRKYTCSECINFSCPLNQVSKDVVDEYLKRNLVMRRTWEENGWQIGGKS
ncbi:MAG: hypothetical protein U9Q18_01710 [Caldisericota bacterium]|nr:hypothetical protein [Caldisericota bacterium]